MPFKVMTTESVLQEKKRNLFLKLKTCYGVTELQLEGIDMLMKTGDHKASLTQFASTHLGGVGRDQVDFKGLSAKFVKYLGVPQDKYGDCCALIESYLHCFASFVV